MAYWVIGLNGQRFGPVDIDRLRLWALEGRIVSGTTIITDPGGQHLLAGEMPELAGYISQPPVVTAQLGQAAGPVVGADGRPLRSKVAAGLLGILLGSIGAHRFYLGYTGVGVAMLLITVLTCGYGSIITGIWGLVEGIMCLTGSFTDAAGNPLRD